MKIILDTGPMLGLLSKNDPYHIPATAQGKSLLKRGAILIVPRIVYIEALGHITRIVRKKSPNSDAHALASQFHQRLASYSTCIIEHEVEDFSTADELWTKYRDWPVDYPDVLIAVTTERIKCDRLWTMDTEFERLLIHAFPGLQNLRDRRN